MVNFEKFILPNGLVVLFHQDKTTPIAALNIIYKVGSRDEEPDKTGFAHLFEHLMFEGSKHIPNFDRPLEEAGGSSNAFTTHDFTSYYLTIPKDNIETALWLESDRMLELDFNPEKLEIQKNVVIEEFKETVLDTPYGDDYKLTLSLAYKHHPYRWSVIGESFEHIQKASLQDVKNFFFKYYAPNNAILSIGGNFDFEQIKKLIYKWFADIPSRNVPPKTFPQEPEQLQPRTLKVLKDVPYDEIILAFHTFPRTDFGTYVTDIISDILTFGSSSRLYTKLVKEKNLFSEIDSYLTGTLDKGLIIIYGILKDGIDPDLGLQAIWDELELLKKQYVNDKELQKVKNNDEAQFMLGKIDIKSRVMNLAYYEMLGGAQLYSIDFQNYNRVTKEDIIAYANLLFQPYRANTIYYLSKKKH